MLPYFGRRLLATIPVMAVVAVVVFSLLRLTAGEVQDLVAFVRNGLLDPRAAPARLCAPCGTGRAG